MIHLKNDVLINKGFGLTFQVATDVERWKEFLPTHRDMKIISKENDKVLIEWKMEWLKLKTQISIDRENKKMVTEQISGLVKGLKAEYIFKEEENKIRLFLVHGFKSSFPVIGGIVELIVMRSLKRLGQDTLNRIKEKVEK